MDNKNIIPEGKKATDEYLMHYGVMGMKWGVRNAETLRKYSGSARKAVTSGGNAIGKTLGKVGSKAAKTAKQTAKNISRKVKTNKKERQIEKQRAKNAKMTRSQYRKTAENNEELRRQALLSNDPTVITRGLHTLSDEEVRSKMVRLVNEQKIRDMQPKEAKSAKKVVGDIVKQSAQERILKPLVNEAADQAKNALKDQIFGNVSKSTGVSKETLEAAATAVEKTVKKELNNTPAAEVLGESKASESFERFSRYSGNYGSGENEPAAMERYSRESADYSKARKVRGSW